MSLPVNHRQKQSASQLPSTYGGRRIKLLSSLSVGVDFSISLVCWNLEEFLHFIRLEKIDVT
jgi:hypothetical protein